MILKSPLLLTVINLVAGYGEPAVKTGLNSSPKSMLTRCYTSVLEWLTLTIGEAEAQMKAAILAIASSEFKVLAVSL